MQNLNDVHARLLEKKREAREITKVFKDEFANNPRYQQVIETLKQLKEEKKSIENQVVTMHSSDAEKLDALKLDIASDKELLADIAINKVADGETVEVVDRFGVKYVPQYSVTFKKDEDADELDDEVVS